jgi:hypothetical protein
MSRYRVRAFTARREPVILKIVADNPYDAAAQAGKQIGAEHPDILRTLDQLSVRKMADSKQGAVYIGRPVAPGSRKGKGKGATAPAATAATTAATVPATTTAATVPAKPNKAAK